MTVLAAESLHVQSADGSDLLTDVSLAVSRGETVLVCGPPGCGKTLLAKALRGLLDDRRDLRVSGTIRRDGSIGFVFQRPATQLVRRFVRQDVAFGLENLGIPVDTIEARIDRYATLLESESLLDREVRDLSGGETAKVALLGILVTEPDVLLLDEPISTLDHRNTRLVLEAIDRLERTGTAVVIAEHDLRDLLVRADRLLLLSGGRTVADGPPVDLVDELRASGVKLPFATEVGTALRAAGEDVDVPLSDGAIEVERS